MPTCEYGCERCGHEFTTVLTVREHDKARPKCPRCKSRRAQQAVSAVFVNTSRKG